MVVEEVAGVSVGLISEIGQVALWIQAIGIGLIVWAVFQILSIWYSAKRINEVYRIKKDMARIEKKIDQLIKRK